MAGARPSGTVTFLFTRGRLVTVTGAPGAGKTRLAFEIAGTMYERYPDGVWCIELARLRDGELIAPEILATMGLNSPVNTAPVDALCEQVAGSRTLLVIDNCEHLLTDVALVVHRLLRAGTGLSVLATSRHGMDTAGEFVWPLPPLAVPTDGEAGEPELSDSLRLFQERALAARPDIDLTEKLGTVAEICRKLDGLPLALELAATRLRTMTVEELAERLEDRFRLLSHGDPADVEHHKTLRAVVDWSHDLLSLDEQAVYRSLAVFQGGWTIEAAVVVCPSGQIGAYDVHDIIDSLVTNSLVVSDSSSSLPRFHMLETIGEHGLKLLPEHGDAEEVRNRHLMWVLALNGETGAALDGPQQQLWLDRLDAELDNVRAAFSWGLSGGDPSMRWRPRSRVPAIGVRAPIMSARCPDASTSRADAAPNRPSEVMR